ncbi:VOC family protein [Ramlibacter humi]|uniref:Drug:proton antiporter n=1 Tax=Ramlibacter humi TaxID=2530451 RepID=A0A4Z0BU77_9BURK|nr:VOC family protein [Ramlibacter humi]TFZ01818.1 drug:proton antiporter [Ramlibacter humi]
MPPTHFILLHVQDPLASARFYARLLGREPVESAPTFAMLEFAPGVMLGLWKRDGVQPAVRGTPGAAELSWVLRDETQLRDWHARWSADGVAIAQPVTKMDFGTCFTALDPDGHRLRPFVPAVG